MGPNIKDTDILTFRNYDEDIWFEWDDGTNEMRINIKGEMFGVDTTYIAEKHILDSGIGKKYEYEFPEREDLAKIRRQYDEAIQHMPVLKKLRKEYDELREKHKLLDKIRGDESAEI